MKKKRVFFPMLCEPSVELARGILWRRQGAERRVQDLRERMARRTHDAKDPRLLAKLHQITRHALFRIAIAE